MRERCGISSIRPLIISKGQLASLIGNSLNNRDTDDQVFAFNSTIMNIVTNFIPNETITCYDRGPPWMNSWYYEKPYPCNLFVKAITCTVFMLLKIYKTLRFSDIFRV